MNILKVPKTFLFKLREKRRKKGWRFLEGCLVSWEFQRDVREWEGLSRIREPFWFQNCTGFSQLSMHAFPLVHSTHSLLSHYSIYFLYIFSHITTHHNLIKLFTVLHTSNHVLGNKPTCDVSYNKIFSILLILYALYS